VSATATPTHCPYCSLQCGISLTTRGAGRGVQGGSSPLAQPLPGNRPATLQPQLDFPTNRGGLCSKGWTAATLLDHPQRLLTPLVRSVPGDRTSEFRAASWNEALMLIVSKITELQAVHGPDAIGCFGGGGGLTNEKAYAFGKFARVALRTSMIDYNGRFCMSSAATAANRAFGIDRGLPFPLPDITEAETILLVGSNPAATMPPAMQFFDAGRAAGATHIVVDPRRTATAHESSRHLAPWPGTDLALANGLLHLAIKHDGIDRSYIASRTKGFHAVQASVAAYWPDRVERITGISVAELYETVEALATARTGMILTARGAEQHSTGTETAQAFINLALALGLPGRPGSGYGTITARATARAAASMARKLTSYRVIASWLTQPTALTSQVCGVWTHPISLSLGYPRSRCWTGRACPAACAGSWCWHPTSPCRPQI
jgi:assimilatory nitrate reductase catalytic subunit